MPQPSRATRPCTGACSTSTIRWGQIVGRLVESTQRYKRWLTTRSERLHAKNVCFPTSCQNKERETSCLVKIILPHLPVFLFVVHYHHLLLQPFHRLCTCVHTCVCTRIHVLYAKQAGLWSMAVSLLQDMSGSNNGQGGLPAMVVPSDMIQLARRTFGAGIPITPQGREDKEAALKALDKVKRLCLFLLILFFTTSIN